jgi:hypothetical protein
MGREVGKRRGVGYFGDSIWWLRYLLKDLLRLLRMMLGHILTSLLNWLLLGGLLLGIQKVLKSRRLNSDSRHDRIFSECFPLGSRFHAVFLGRNGRRFGWDKVYFIPEGTCLKYCFFFENV